jgi:ABC-type lipoprotein export system ATPase subunit
MPAAAPAPAPAAPAPAAPAVLQVTGVTLDYEGRPGALRDVNLRVARGQVVVVEGRSGSGKSSLMQVCAGLVPPTAGSVAILGRPLQETSREDAKGIGRGGESDAARGHIGLVFQHLHLLGELTARENVELPLRLRHAPRKAARERADAILALFGMTALADRLPHTLSGGERQRVAIARALATGPDLLLVDEPTSSLDRANAIEVAKALRAAAEAGAAVLVATHDELLRGLGEVLTIDDGVLRPRVGSNAPPPPPAPSSSRRTAP